jgi:hypothetical protein
MAWWSCVSRFAAVHNRADCGEVAFFLKEVPFKGQPFRTEMAVLPDGKRPPKGRQAECYECGGTIHLKEIIFVYEDLPLPTCVNVYLIPTINL